MKSYKFRAPILLLLVMAILLTSGLYIRPELAPEAFEPMETASVAIDDVVIQGNSSPTIELLNTEQEQIEPIVEEPEIVLDQAEVEVVAKALYGEYRGPNKLQQAAVVWTILNRVDYYGDSIIQITTAPGQFHGYNPKHPLVPELVEMVEDVMTRWKLEQAGETDVGRILPKDYMWFAANKTYTANNFRNKYSGHYTYWDWSLPNPYEVTE